MKIVFPAQLLKVASRSDRSYVLTFNTRELRGIDAAHLLNDLMNEGWLVWSPSDDITEADIPNKAPDAGINAKSPSQRLRSIIFQLWKQGGEQGDFPGYYATVMARLADSLKEKLD